MVYIWPGSKVSKAHKGASRKGEDINEAPNTEVPVLWEGIENKLSKEMQNVERAPKVHVVQQTCQHLTTFFFLPKVAKLLGNFSFP